MAEPGAGEARRGFVGTRGADGQEAPPQQDRAAWDAFFDTTFGTPYMVWHDGPDFSALHGLEGAARQEARRMLSIGLALGDPIAAQALGELGAGEVRRGSATTRGADGQEDPPQQDAVAELEAALPAAAGTLRVRVAEALYRLTGNARFGDAVAEALEAPLHWTHRIDAAIALRGFPPAPRAVRALLAAVASDDYLVRYHAATTLRAYAGETSDITSDPDLFGAVCGPPDGAPITAEHRAAFREAARTLGERVAKVLGG